MKRPRTGTMRAVVAVLSFTAAPTAAAPLPAPVQALLAPAAPVPANAPVELLLDGSLSMAGYARSPDPNRRPLGDTLAIVKDFAANAGAPLAARAFGAAFKPVPTAALDAWGTPAAYECAGRPGCDNLESRIDTALNAVAAAKPATLSVLVSDLWLDTSSFSGALPVALGLPLKNILAGGRAVAVVGIRAPFNGTVYGFPGTGNSASNYRGATERALFLVVAGPRPRVDALLAALRASGSPSFTPAAMRVTVFERPARPARAAAPTPIGSGVVARAPAASLPRAAVDWSDAARDRPLGRLFRAYDLAAALPAAAAWRGPLAADTRLWRFTGGAWQPFPLPATTWKPAPKGHAAAFAFAPAAIQPKLPAGRYLLLGTLGTARVASPEPAAAWMRQWSLPPAPGKPRFVGALGLAQLAGVLETAVSVNAPRLGFAMALDIED